jgi:hypothetical protein
LLVWATDAVVCLHVDTHKVVSGADDATLRLFDVRMGEALWHAEEPQPVRYVHCTDRTLLYASYARAPRRYNPRQWYRANAGRLSWLNFSPAANVSRVHEEYRSEYVPAPARSAYRARLTAVYDDLLGEDGIL